MAKIVFATASLEKANMGAIKVGIEVKKVLMATEHVLYFHSNDDEYGSINKSMRIMPLIDKSELNLFTIVGFLKYVKYSLLNIYRTIRIKAINPDLVINNDDHFLFPDNRRNKRKHVYIMHSSPDFESVKNQLGSLLKILSEYDYIIYVSRVCMNKWITLGASRLDNSFYIPNCCDEERLGVLTRLNKSEVREKLELPANKKIICMPGKIMKRKGADLFCELIRTCINNGSIDELTFVSLGNHNTEYYTTLKHLYPKEMEIIIFIGFKEEPYEYLYASDVLFIPSRAEALPLVVLEGMALGVPIIASDVDGIPEMIDNGINGYMFSWNNIDAIYEYVDILLNDKNKYKLISGEANTKYYTCFARELFHKRYMEFLDRVV
jgi:glycosyltransferase involved in cell wall biosynthesis